MLTEDMAARLPEHLNWDLIGAGLPVHDAPPLALQGLRDGLLGAAARGDRGVYDELAELLWRDGFVVAELGGFCSRNWHRLVAEGEQLWPAMKPGVLSIATAASEPAQLGEGQRVHTSEQLGSYPPCGSIARGQYHKRPGAVGRQT